MKESHVVCLADIELPPPITVAREGDAITFTDEPHGEFYYVEGDALTTEEEYGDWILQLSQKTWCTRDVLQSFMALAVAIMAEKGRKVIWE